MKIAIIGNSGSGKTTLAYRLASTGSIPVLDLDSVFWQPGTTIERPSAERVAAVQRFCRQHECWIVEGCYTDLIETSLQWNPELVFLNPGRDTCVENCRRRPLEPHKYVTQEDQDKNLPFLLDWVAEYYHRDGPISYRSHKALFDKYSGPKREYKNEPNKAVEPTPVDVTIPAAQEVAPSTSAAHLGR